MKRLLLSFILLVTVIITMRGQDYKIDCYKYEATVTKANVWMVKETIDVTFLESRHGIYRNIPRQSASWFLVNGEVSQYHYSYSIDKIDVGDNSYEVTDNPDDKDYLLIRIGNPDQWVLGPASYVIQYVIQYPDDRIPEFDFINSNILGTDWYTTIDNFSFVVKFEKDLPDNLGITIHSGVWGSTGNNLDVEIDRTSNIISGQMAHIEPNNGITIYATLPEGFWENPKSNKTKGMLFAACTLALLAVMIAVLMYRKRRRPMVVYEYSAPDGICSAEVGVIIDDSADCDDLNSLIVWFASKGYLKIRETNAKGKPDIELTKLRDLPEDAPDYQKKYFKVFFAKSETISLANLSNRWAPYNSALLMLGRHFKGERKLIEVNKWLMWGALAYLILVMLTFAYSNDVESWDKLTMEKLFYFFHCPVAICMLARMYLSRYDMIKKNSWIYLQMVVIALVAVVSAAYLWPYVNNSNDWCIGIPVLDAILAGGWILVVLSGRMFTDTPYRISMMQRLLGFRDFIEMSELPMLKQQVDENPAYFYDILPYAMVFGLTDKWKQHFNNIKIKKPTWYKSDSPEILNDFTGRLTADHLIHSLDTTIRDAITDSSRPPESHSSGDSFSGDSFSGDSCCGGGGGGGGGGSW